MKQYFLIVIILIAVHTSFGLQAQIGYQVSLLNTATGEPRANVTVNAQVIITNAENELVYSCIQPSTSNDFGVLNFTIGNEDTFKDVNWNKLPFFIEVQVDGNTIGKSQILTVPIAEYAKKTGQLTKEILVGTWVYDVTQKNKGESSARFYYDSEHYIDHDYFYDDYRRNKVILVFYENGTYELHSEYWSWTVGKLDYWDASRPDEDVPRHFDPYFKRSGNYYISGNNVITIDRIEPFSWYYFSDHGWVDTREWTQAPREATSDKVHSSYFTFIPEDGILCSSVLGERLLAYPFKKE